MLVFDWNHQFAPSWSTFTRRVISSLPLCNWGALKTLAASAETHLQKDNQQLEINVFSHMVIVSEFGPLPHSESGKGVSSKCDSVRESSEIHHSSTALQSHHTEKACRKCSPWASSTWTKTKKGGNHQGWNRDILNKNKCKRRYSDSQWYFPHKVSVREFKC